ncbi:hypothetical protein [Roseateles amylovorans]|uniref:Uncharacterized protein n=1 Tax=Roseateles amylovorans TaxID=2978473 RepID=A0ABY6B0P7_9BURK|nr:hypothetical protein [Roseateles amylovorans]UXH78133.1 hypothetical protein N4261_24805 [Roseateles amylovorans]
MKAAAVGSGISGGIGIGIGIGIDASARHCNCNCNCNCADICGDIIPAVHCGDSDA